MNDAAIYYRSVAASQLPFRSRRTAMSRAQNKRRVVGTVTQVGSNQCQINGQWFQLADRAQDRRMPTLGQLIAFDAYDYGRGVETFFKFEDPSAPQPETPARAFRSFTPAAATPDRSFEVRRIALECASRTCRDYAASALIDFARQLEAYLSPLVVASDEAEDIDPQPAVRGGRAVVTEMPAISAEQIVAALQAIGAPEIAAQLAAPTAANGDVPIRRKRSRAIA